MGNHIQCIEWYHFQWPWLTPDRDFKVAIFSTLNISETTWDTVEHQWKVIWSWSNGGIFDDLHGPLTQFSRSRHFWIFEVEYLWRTKFRPVSSFLLRVVPTLLLPSPFPSLSSPLLSPLPFSSPSPFPSRLLLSLPLSTKSSWGSGERCNLPQWFRAEPGRQTHFGAIEGQNLANHVNKCSQRMTMCCGGPRTPCPLFGYGPDVAIKTLIGNHT